MGDSYQNYFTALPSSIPTLPCPDVPLPVAHTQQAVVVSNEDPKKLGRVQVKMNWQTGPMQTSWIRVLTPDAGTSDKVATNRGFVFIPERETKSWWHSDMTTRTVRLCLAAYSMESQVPVAAVQTKQKV